MAVIKWNQDGSGYARQVGPVVDRPRALQNAASYALAALVAGYASRYGCELMLCVSLLPQCAPQCVEGEGAARAAAAAAARAPLKTPPRPNKQKKTKERQS